MYNSYLLPKEEKREKQLIGCLAKVLCMLGPRPIHDIQVQNILQNKTWKQILKFLGCNNTNMANLTNHKQV